jgi:septal ring factor EnvC (AmiA/AmiB activator)
MTFLSDVEQKISNLEAELKKHSNYVTEITQAVEKLLSDKATSSNNINIINGALQAYRDVLSASKTTDAAQADATVTEEVNG